MLFQSDYWVAVNDHEKTEAIRDFLETDEGIKTLVIIDPDRNYHAMVLLDKIQEESMLPCSVNLFTDTERYLFEATDITEESHHTKTIYICNQLDNGTVELLKKHQPILLIFS